METGKRIVIADAGLEFRAILAHAAAQGHIVRLAGIEELPIDVDLSLFRLLQSMDAAQHRALAAA